MVKELNEIKRKDISYGVRLEMAIKIRDFRDAAPVSREFSVEAFNNTNLFRSPDTIGITIWYPNKENPTHITTGIFPASMGEVAFGKQAQRLERELNKKINRS